MELSPVKELNPIRRSIGFNDIKGFPKKQGKSKIRRYFKLIRKEIYPHLKFNLRHNAKYSTNDFLDLVTHTALNHDFTNNGSKTYGLVNGNSPHGDTTLYHIRKHKPTDYFDMFQNANEQILRLAKRRGLLKGKVDVAIDYTDHLYYGDKNTPMVMGTRPQRGTQYAYKYATINIVEEGMRFTLMALPVTQLKTSREVLERLVSYALEKVNIRYVYVDRGFFSGACMRTLEKLGVKYIMPAVQHRRIKKIVENNEPVTVMDYKMTYRDRFTRRHVRFKLAIIKSNTNPENKVVFATNVYELNTRNAVAICNNYSKRWGIETSYRVKNMFRTRTTSKNYQVRLFFFLFSVCLYNLWVLVNAFVEAFVFGRALKTPYLTAKVFGAILISTSFYIDDGG